MWKEAAMEWVLVTGGAGFIGSHLCEPALKHRNIGDLVTSPLFERHEGDIRDRTILADLCRRHRFDAVLHLAARPGVRPSIENPLLYEDINVRGTLNMLEICREFGMGKFLFASSSSVYGERKGVPFSEEEPADFPVSPYGATKRAGELLCYTYHRLYGFDVACLRIFTAFGPRQRPEMAIHKFTRLIDQGKPVPMYGRGDTQRDYTYIDDLIDGLFKALTKGKGYQIYNLGESRTTRLIDLIEMIQRALGKTAIIEKLPDQPGDVPITFADITKARRELGYNPRFDMEEGISRFVAWYKTERL
jgi:UDP-glucuronate 4-epimerase